MLSCDLKLHPVNLLLLQQQKSRKQPDGKVRYLHLLLFQAFFFYCQKMINEMFYESSFFFLQPLKKNSSRGELNKILSLFLVVIPKCTFQRFFFSKLKLEGKSREIKSRNNFFPLFTYFFYHHHRRRRHRERRKRKWLLCVESSSLFYTFNSSSSSKKWFNEILTVWRGPLLSN